MNNQYSSPENNQVPSPNGARHNQPQGYGQPQDYNQQNGYGQPQSYGQPQRNNNKIIIAIAAVAAIIAIAVAAFFMLRGGDAGADMSKDEFKSQIEKLTAESGFSRDTLKQSGLTDDHIDFYYQCITDDIYDEVSDDFKSALAKEDLDAPLSNSDQTLLNDAVTSCATQLQQQM